jgi:hypothetical protein
MAGRGEMAARWEPEQEGMVHLPTLGDIWRVFEVSDGGGPGWPRRSDVNRVLFEIAMSRVTGGPCAESKLHLFLNQDRELYILLPKYKHMAKFLFQDDAMVRSH